MSFSSKTKPTSFTSERRFLTVRSYPLLVRRSSCWSNSCLNPVPWDINGSLTDRECNAPCASSDFTQSPWSMRSRKASHKPALMLCQAELPRRPALRSYTISWTPKARQLMAHTIYGLTKRTSGATVAKGTCWLALERKSSTASWERSVTMDLLRQANGSGTQHMRCSAQGIAWSASCATSAHGSMAMRSP